MKIPPYIKKILFPASGYYTVQKTKSQTEFYDIMMHKIAFD